MHVQLMREITVHAMAEGTAQARIQQALSTKTRPAGQSCDSMIGDLVDYHRTAPAKGASG